jgi:glutathione S-transferase
MATHIALHEIGVPFISKPLSFANKEQQAPEFLAINPEGKVPTLVVEDRVLTEVAGTLYYLARAFPQAKLWPEGDIEKEAQVISWMSFIASTLHPSRVRGIEYARSVYTFANTKLGKREWAVGSYTIADIHLFRLYWRFRGSLQPAPGSFAALDAHAERMMARPAVRKTLEIESKIGYELPV